MNRVGATVLGVVLLLPSLASAHIYIRIPDGRTDRDNLQMAPCGGFARGSGAPAAVYAPGETIMIEWEETIDHPGTWRIAFSPAGDTGFDDNVLAEGPDNAGIGFYRQMVTLPTTPCDDCTLQVYQYMDPRFHPPPDYYYACADIIIRPIGGDAGPLPDEDAGPVAGEDAGPTGGTDAGSTLPPGSTDEGGCGCAVPARPLAPLSLGGALAFVALAAARLRRRLRR